MDLSTLANAAESALATYGNSQTAVTNDQTKIAALQAQLATDQTQAETDGEAAFKALSDLRDAITTQMATLPQPPAPAPAA
ncbi:MAG TPA: hypothetical protein VN737_04225 [Bryobacteraceae bacterium]|nr:hypothetical protein [Bryobacteraceae bacterium]